jgi:hypothetical protein
MEPAADSAALAGTAGAHGIPGVERMTASLSLVAGIVALSVVIGAADLLRQPTWAWRAADEPKIVCLLLVVLLPGVGLAIYGFGARPKVVEIARNGRAASLPFERFGDRTNTGVASDRAIQALAATTTRGSFGEANARPIRTNQGTVGTPAIVPARATYFDDPDVVSISATDFLAAGGMVAAPMPTETVTGLPPETLIRIPGQVGKAYNPRQRTSLDEGPLREPSLAELTTEIAPDGTFGGGPASASRPVPQPVGAGSMAAGMSTMPAPRIGTSTPEIFRARPNPVAPIAGSGAAASAPLSSVAARWMNDPTGRHQHRYWDGGQWTENVYDAGVESRDPVHR